MIRQQIIDDMKIAMKAQDSVKLGVLRYMLSEIKNKEIDAKHELNDEEVIGLLRTEVKRRNDAVVQFKQGNRMDLAEKEEIELGIINSYLPKMMDSADIESTVTRIIESSDSRDFGQIMKMVMQELGGQADGKTVSEIVRAKLN